MRTIGTGNAAQPTSGFGPDAITAVKVEVTNASDVLVDLSSYTVAVEYDSSADEIVDAATVVFRRLEGVNSLAPLMTASPPVDLGRRIVVSINAGSGTYKEVFRGKITDVDWPERFGDVTVQCLDQARDASRTWIETAREYGSTAGVSLETVMQAVATDNLTSPPTLYFPAATSAVVQHVAGDAPYGPTEQSVLDAERALAESYGGTIRWRYIDSLSAWRWTVFTPSRTKTVPDHTFGTSDYFDVKQIKLSDADIRNVIEVEYIGEGGARESVTVSDATSIAAYGRLYAKISEGSDSPVNNATLATALGNAALSDLKEPDVLLEIACRYFWPGEIGVDLYRFTANGKHFSSDQDLAPMQFRHRIAVGESPTTHIAVRGKPSGGVLSWRRRVTSDAGLASAPELKAANFREVARTATTATIGWNPVGAWVEGWIYLSTPAQPLGSDPWAALTGVPYARLTAASTSYEITVPPQGKITYGRLLPIGAAGASGQVTRGTAWDFTVQPGTAERLIQRATVTATGPTTVTVSVAVANPTTGSDIVVTPNGVNATVAEGAQTILAAAVTDDLATTGTKTFTITRPAFQTGSGRVTFTATSTDRLPDIDAVDVPAVEPDTAEALLVRGTAQSSSSTQIVFRVAVADPASLGSGNVSIAYVATGTGGVSPASPQAILSASVTNNIDTTGYVDFTVTRADAGTGTGQVTFTVTRTGVSTGVLGLTVPDKDRDFTVAPIDTTEIANLAVTAAKIGAAAVEEAKVAVGAITTTKIADDSVTTAKLVALSVVAAKIAAGAIEADKIAASAVTTAKLDAMAVTTDKLAANSVVAAKIGAGEVTAAKISVTNLAAINADLGTVTAGYIQNSGNTAAIRLSGATALPSNNYIDFTATGASPFISHSQFVLNADGTTGSPRFRCKVHRTATQSISNESSTSIAWTSEFADTGSLHDNTTNNSRITVPTGGNVGFWLLNAQISFDGNATGWRWVIIRHYTGTTTLTIAQALVPGWLPSFTIGGIPTDFQQPVRVSALVTAPAVGAYFYVEVRQNSGGSLNVNSDLSEGDTVTANYGSWFEAIHVW